MIFHRATMRPAIFRSAFCILFVSMMSVGAEQDSSEKHIRYTQTIGNTGVSFEMVPIPGGEFLMGSPSKESGRNRDESPQHRVTIEPFWMGSCEVTWDQFELWSMQRDFRQRTRQKLESTEDDRMADAVTKPTPSYVDLSFGSGIKGYPVICVTQHAARKYCEWLSAKTGRYHRLPTEAEWEYACRAGTTTAYSFGDDPARLDEYAWHAGNSAAPIWHPVGKKKPNPWGLFDMHGNVGEWVLDKYDPAFYGTLTTPADSPLLVAEREYPRVVRGGSWESNSAELRSAARLGSTPEWKQSDPQIPKSAWYITDAPFVGFRIIRPLRVPTSEERRRLHLDAVVPTDVKENSAR